MPLNRFEMQDRIRQLEAEKQAEVNKRVLLELEVMRLKKELDSIEIVEEVEERIEEPKTNKSGLFSKVARLFKTGSLK